MKTKVLLLLGIVFIVAAAIAAFAAPNTPEQLINGTAESRAVDNTQKTVNAYAGNVTQLTIYHTMITKRWQGYYGNVSGIITLDDANNWTLYDWSLGRVEGEIYASNSSGVQWGTARCINLSSTYRGNNCTGQNEACLNVTEIERGYGMNSDDVDGVDETFNNSLGSVMVGTNPIYNCPMVNLYVNNTRQANNYWNETMLTYNNSETIIYAAIVNDDAFGFNNRTWDFQMIVGDNGEDNLPTTYYFYVELT